MADCSIRTVNSKQRIEFNHANKLLALGGGRIEKKLQRKPINSSRLATNFKSYHTSTPQKEENNAFNTLSNFRVCQKCQKLSLGKDSEDCERETCEKCGLIRFYGRVNFLEQPPKRNKLKSLLRFHGFLHQSFGS